MLLLHHLLLTPPLAAATATALLRQDGGLAGPKSCSFYGGARVDAEPLFEYFRQVANGSEVPVSSLRDPETRLCYYPEAHCSPTEACCGLSALAARGRAYSLNICNIGQGLVFFVAIQYLQKWLRKQMFHGQTGPGGAKVGQGTAGSQQQRPPGPPSGVNPALNQVGIYVGITIRVTTGIILATSIQTLLPMTQRNAMMAVGAFLEPVKDVFQFLEDTTTVKITTALGSGQIAAIRPTLWIGVIGGLASGAFAATLMTGLSFWTGATQVLIAPEPEVSGCSLVPGTRAVMRAAWGYWLLRVWSWPFEFCNLVFVGLLMGAGEFLVYLVPVTLQCITMIVLWFFGPGAMDLTRLGLATFGSAVVFSAACTLVLLLHVPLRSQLGLLWHANPVGTAAAAELREEEDRQVEWEGIRDGLYAMCLDLVLQGSGTVVVYVAGFQSHAALYQISAVSGAMPQYSSFADGLGYVVKLMGGVLLGSRKYELFKTLMLAMLGVSFTLGVINAVAIFPFQHQLAAYYSVEACGYASDQACMGLFYGIFGAEGSSVFGAFNVLGILAPLNCVFSVVRACMYASQDFLFMAKSAAWVFVAAFLPAVLLARFAVGTPMALYSASGVPTAVLLMVFLYRLRSTLHTLTHPDPELRVPFVARTSI